MSRPSSSPRVTYGTALRSVLADDRNADHDLFAARPEVRPAHRACRPPARVRRRRSRRARWSPSRRPRPACRSTVAPEASRTSPRVTDRSPHTSPSTTTLPNTTAKSSTTSPLRMTWSCPSRNPGLRRIPSQGPSSDVMRSSPTGGGPSITGDGDSGSWGAGRAALAGLAGARGAGAADGVVAGDAGWAATGADSPAPRGQVPGPARRGPTHIVTHTRTSRSNRVMTGMPLQGPCGSMPPDTPRRRCTTSP